MSRLYDTTGKYVIKVVHLAENGFATSSPLRRGSIRETRAALYRGDRKIMGASAYVKPGETPIKKIGYRLAVTRLMEAARAVYGIRFAQHNQLEDELFGLEEKYWKKNRRLHDDVAEYVG